MMKNDDNDVRMISTGIPSTPYQNKQPPTTKLKPTHNKQNQQFTSKHIHHTHDSWDEFLNIDNETFSAVNSD